MNSIQKIYTLQLRYPFGISRGVSYEAHTALFQLGDLGQGESAPVRYKGQSPEDAVVLLEKMAAVVTGENIDDIDGLEARALQIAPDHSSARNAFNNALWDARGRRLGKPIYELVGTARPTIETTYTVSLSDNDTMETRAREAAHLPLLKVKLGRDMETDFDIMARIRKVAPKAVLRIDANAGWSLETALAIIPKLADLGVEFIEQPLAIGNLDGLKTLHEKSPLPIVADEDAQDMSSLPGLRGRVAGINIKLTKCGGISEALRMIAYARNEGWKVMFGCMLETRSGLGAAAHLGGLADCMDLDAHMLTTNDPFPPGSLAEFNAALPLGDGPGLGLPFVSF